MLIHMSPIILYPTETVYGLGVNAFDADAMKRLYTLKARDEKKAVSWLVRDYADIERYADVHEQTAKIASRFLPGPLTLVLPLKHNAVPLHLSSTQKIGFRISSDIFAQKVIHDFMEQYNAPLTCTSANVSGMQTEDTVSQILAQFGEQKTMIDIIHDDGIRRGTPSTVIEVHDSTITLLREGAVLFSEIVEHLEH